MAEEVLKMPVKKKGGWFQKIPTDIILSPGGILLISLAVIIEVLDLIPLPIIDQIWELPLELLFMVMLFFIAKTPLKTMILPFIIERIPFISDVLPTWFLRMIM